MIIYQVTLPKKQDAEAFVTFMREEYFPAVHKGPTRVGQVTDLVLVQKVADTEAAGHEFFLQMGWSGLAVGDIRIDDQAVADKFDAFDAHFKRMGSYAEVANWHADDAV